MRSALFYALGTHLYNLRSLRKKNNYRAGFSFFRGSSFSPPHIPCYTHNIMVEDVLGKLCALFDSGKAQYRVLHHEAGDRTSESVAKIRGTELGQGAKALVCMIKGGGVKQYVLAVLPSDQQADLHALAHAFGGKHAGLASPGEVMDLTGCVLGAVPPVSFDPRLVTVADPTLFTRYDEIAFNAGARDVSIIINTQDFHRIVQPREISFLRTSDSE